MKCLNPVLSLLLIKIWYFAPYRSLAYKKILSILSILLCFLLWHHQSFLHRFIILLHLISSFTLNRCLLVPYAYVSIKSIDCILLSWFELQAILLISSVKTFYLSLLNPWCVFNIDLLFLINSLWFSLRRSMSILFFINNLFYSRVQLLLNSFYNPQA